MKASVLIVDDHRDTCALLAKLFSRAGMEASYVDNGPGALSALDAHWADVVLLDVMMPGMTGLDVLRRIRMDERLENVAVVMYSALSDMETEEEARRLGAQAFVVKGRTEYGKLEAMVRSYASGDAGMAKVV